MGFIGGFYAKTSMDEAQLIKEKEKQTSIAALMSESKIRQLREKIEQDEADYGNDYQKINAYYLSAYKKEPDRIYFKSSKIGAFYVFEKGEEISTHAAGGDTMVTVLEGKGKFTISGDEYLIEEGQTIIMPKDIPHSAFEEEKFKMILVVSF